MLLSAGTAARREGDRARMQALLAEIDQDHLIASLERMRLLGTLGPRIVALAAMPNDRPFRDRVASTLESGRRQGAFLQLISERVIGMLEQAGIGATPLKGPALGEAIYGEPGRRRSSDVDLLVAPHQLADATEVVRTLGYAAPADPVRDDGLPLLHFALVHRQGELPPVELHWRVHWYESSFATERLLAPAAGDARDWRPQPVDDFAALLLFYARDGFVGLRHACDIGAWWDTYGEGVQRGEIDALTANYPALERAIGSALAVAEQVVGLPSGRIAGEPRRLRLRSAVAVRLRDPCARSGPAQQYAQMGLVDGLLTPPRGLRAFLARQLTPPSAGGAGSGGGSWRHSVGRGIGHSVRVLGRYALALLGLLGPQRQVASRCDRIEQLADRGRALERAARCG